MFVLALSLYNTWNRGVFLLCKITNLLIYSSEKDFCDELKKEAVGNSKDILFSLRKINTAVTQLMKEIDKKK